MCLCIESFSCGHVTKSVRHCLPYQQRLSTAQAIYSQKSFFARIFSSSPKILCNERAGRKTRYYPCKDCLTRTQRREEQDQEERAKKQKREEDKAAWDFQVQHEIKQEKNAKLAFRCEACRREGRRPGERNRRANNGFCCARGAEEFEAGNRYVPSKMIQLKQTDSFQEDASPGLDPALGNDQKLESLWSSESQRQLIAREAASRAAREYGWASSKRDSYIEPHLVARVYAQPGTSLKSLAPQRPQQPLPWIVDSSRPSCNAKQPFYQVGIDEDRWRSISQTGHGTIPAPTPPPERPLPIRPLVAHSTRLNGNSNGPIKASTKSCVAKSTAQESLTPIDTESRKQVGERKSRVASSHGMTQAPQHTDLVFHNPSSFYSANELLPSQRGRDLIALQLVRRHHTGSDTDSVVSELSSLARSQSPVSPMSLTHDVEPESKRTAAPFEALANMIDDATESWQSFSHVDKFV